MDQQESFIHAHTHVLVFEFYISEKRREREKNAINEIKERIDNENDKNVGNKSK